MANVEERGRESSVKGGWRQGAVGLFRKCLWSDATLTKLCSAVRTRLESVSLNTESSSTRVTGVSAFKVFA